MKKTYQELSDFLNQANAMRRGQDGQPEPVTTKFQYALDKNIFRINDAIKKADIAQIYQDKIHTNSVENASTDEKGNLIIENGSYKYSKENQQKLYQANRKATDELNRTEINFEPYIAQQIPELNESQVSVFKGIVITDDYEIPEPEFAE